MTVAVSLLKVPAVWSLSDTLMSSLSLSDVLVCVCVCKKKERESRKRRQQPVFPLFISSYESLPSPSLHPGLLLFLSLLHLSWGNLFISDFAYVRASIRVCVCTSMLELSRSHQSRWRRETSVIILSNDKPSNQWEATFQTQLLVFSGGK